MGSEIEYVDQCTCIYLGTTINAKHTDSDIKRQMKRFNANSNIYSSSQIYMMFYRDQMYVIQVILH